MVLAHSQYIQDRQEKLFHCFNRHLLHAFLCDSDSVTDCDFSHRKEWLVARLQFPASIFGIGIRWIDPNAWLAQANEDQSIKISLSSCSGLV
jgi:hypothetical protein